MRGVAKGTQCLTTGSPTPLPQTLALVDSSARVATGRILKRLRELASTGRLERTYFELNAVVEDCVRITEHEARNKSVAIRVSCTPDLGEVYADRVQIEQVLVNLLRNSMDALMLVKSERRTITVSTTLLDGKTTQVCVSDTGPGIGALTPEALFDPFKTSKPEGMGLGLSISSSLLEAHGGRLWAEPWSRLGAVFCFTLPAGERDDERTD